MTGSAPAGRDLTLALESRLVNAWPSFEVELAEGWLLRFAENYSKRANSATPILPGAALTPDLARAIIGSFEARGVAPCFRLTGVEDPGADGVLAACGLVPYDTSLGMVAALSPGLRADPSVAIRPAPEPSWIAAAAAAYGGDKANGNRLGRIVARIRQPAAFATVRHEGQDAAWGLGVAERGYVGLYDIVVSPGRRGSGLGRRLVSALMEWGRGEGAHHAYLQMRETNAVAGALYRSLGFRTAYRYGHRILPARLPAGGGAGAAPD